MSPTRRWSKRLGIGALALLGLGAVSLQAIPADARVFFDSPPADGYVSPPAFSPYAHPASYAPYYGYPYYGGTIFMGLAGGHRWR